MEWMNEWINLMSGVKINDYSVAVCYMSASDGCLGFKSNKSCRDIARLAEEEWRSHWGTHVKLAFVQEIEVSWNDVDHIQHWCIKSYIRYTFIHMYVPTMHTRVHIMYRLPLCLSLLILLTSLWLGSFVQLVDALCYWFTTVIEVVHS